MRNAFPILIICLVLTLGGGFAWLTQHPESPWLEKATTWPGVGPLASRFRDAYLGPAPTLVMGEDGQLREGSPSEEASEEPPNEGEQIATMGRPVTASTAPAGRDEQRSSGAKEPPPPPETESINELFQISEERVEVRRFTTSTLVPPPPRPVAAIDFSGASGWEWFLPGQPLAGSISPDVIPEGSLPSMAYLPIFSRDGVWAEVSYRGRRIWIDTSWTPPFPRRKSHRGVARQRYEPVQASDREQLDKARRILGIDRPVRFLGPYQLFTDIEDEDLLSFLDLTARKAEDAYFARYGRIPSGDPTRSIALFARQADYQAFADNEKLINAAGHAFAGVLALHAEGRPRIQLAGTMIHEIVHLVNDRALAVFLPTWLEEGLASDLGSVWMEDLKEAASITGRSDDSGLWVPRGGLRILHLGELLDSHQLPKIEMLFQLNYDLFHRQEVGRYAYSHSATFVRFLIEAEDGRYREGFLKFLGKVAAGYGADSHRLLKLIDTDVDELELHFRAWLRREVDVQRQRQAEDGRT